jgi:COP9 signalosome complex subunit 2
MKDLLTSYQRGNIKAFEKILAENKHVIMDDPFIKAYIEDLIMNVRKQVLIKLIKPYQRIRITFLAKVKFILRIIINLFLGTGRI